MGDQQTTPESPSRFPYLFFCDYLPFCMSIGVPAADLSYFYDDENNNFLLYPVYHKRKDCCYWIKLIWDNIVDPMTKLIGGLAFILATLLFSISKSYVMPKQSKILLE